MSEKTPSFEDAMNVTLFWCNSWEKDEISDEVLADRISDLIKTRDGARAFFAVTLSINCPLMDRLPDPLIFQLRKGGAMIVDLAVKNLSMSAAMENKHLRSNDLKQKDRSEMVKRRSVELLNLLETKAVKESVESFMNGLACKGKDKDFLRKWQYDDEQKIAIIKAINSIADSQ